MTRARAFDVPGSRRRGHGGRPGRQDGREIEQRKPVVYQTVGGERREIPGRYRLSGRQAAFEVGAYDVSLPLVIDPILVFSTFVGGDHEGQPSSESASDVALDAEGNVYVVAYTNAAQFPTTPGAQDRDHNGSWDVVVTKLDAQAMTVVYSTYLGGAGVDVGQDIQVDAAGNAYITGYSMSTNLPTTAGAADRAFNGSNDIFVAKLDPAGSTLLRNRGTISGAPGARPSPLATVV